MATDHDRNTRVKSEPLTDAAFVYIDGQNLRGSALKAFGRTSMDADLPKLVKELVATERTAHVAQTRYYTGLESRQSPARRAEEIAFLDRLAANGIKTFANEMQRNAVGELKEVGIDLKLAADMVSDFLKNPKARTFMVVSNDTDFEPAFDLLTHLAKHFRRDIQLVNVVAGDHRGSLNARRRELTQPMFERNAKDQVNYHAVGLKRLTKDRTAALDGTAHAGNPYIATPTTTIAPKRGTGVYVDLNSLGEKAKLDFGRTHLDTELSKLIVTTTNNTNRKITAARAFVSKHTIEVDLVNHIFVTNMALELNRRGMTIEALPYFYKNTVVGTDLRGPGGSSNINAIVGTEKRNQTKILAAVVKDILNGTVDDIVLASDDKNLWPIAEIAREIGTLTKQQIEVANLHFGPTAIDQTLDLPIDLHRYLEFHDETKDRLVAAEKQATAYLAREREQLETQIREHVGEKKVIVRNVREAEGVLFAHTKNWVALDDGRATISILPKLPFLPEPATRYRYRDGELRIEEDRSTGPQRQIGARHQHDKERTRRNL